LLGHYSGGKDLIIANKRATESRLLTRRMERIAPVFFKRYALVSFYRNGYIHEPTGFKYPLRLAGDDEEKHRCTLLSFPNFA
jgi:hypothetical protein